MARLFVAASVVALILAGCGSPAKDAPPAPRIDRLEAEAFNTVDPGCLTDAGPLDLLYRDWASEGIVARLPTSQCGLAFQAQRFISAGSFTRFQIGPLSSPATLRVLVDVAPAAHAEVAARPTVFAGVFADTLRIDAGIHDVRFEYRADPDTPLDLDYLGFALDLASSSNSVGVSGNTTVATTSTSIPIDPAHPLVLEAEHFDRADANCSPTPTGDRVRIEQRAWASAGEVVWLPAAGCGLQFQQESFAAPGHFATFRAAAVADDPSVLVRLRVLADGKVVSAAEFGPDGMPPPVREFPVKQSIPSGAHDLRLEFHLAAGRGPVGVLLDYLSFQSGE
jgi:hypothetical protein